MSQTTSTIKANFNNVYVYINDFKRKQQQSFENQQSYCKKPR